MPTRRDFLTGSAAATLGLILAPRSARATDARTEILNCGGGAGAM